MKNAHINKNQQDIENIAKHYTNRGGDFNSQLAHLGHELFRPLYAQGNFLEIGPADGEMTSLIQKDFSDFTVVEPSSSFCKKIKIQFPSITVNCAFLETFRSDKKYDNIMIAHVLEHVIDPIKALQNAKHLLSPKGKIFLVVPNAMSLHRQAGVLMGMLHKETDLNPLDRKQGHHRVYTLQTFREDILSAGLNIQQLGGFFLKQVPSAQIEQHWSDDLIHAYFTLGQLYPSIASEIFAVCSHPDTHNS